MENDIAVYAASYVFTRLAALAGFAYLFYLILRRPAMPRVPVDGRRHSAGLRSERVADDRC